MANPKLDQLYKAYLALTPEERVSNAKKAYLTLRKELSEKGYDQTDSLELILGLIGVLSCVDGVPGKKEHALFADITKSPITYDQFLHLIQGTKTPEMVEGADHLVDSLSVKGKDAACVFALCFLSADGEIDVYERELFEKLIA